MSDNIQQLVARAQNSDIDSFRQLVEKHQQFAYNVAFRFLTNQEDARDVVQECFIRLWKNLHKVDPHKKLTTWLYKIVLNLCYDEMRRAYNRYKCDPAEKEASFENLKSSDNMEKKLVDLVTHSVGAISNFDFDLARMIGCAMTARPL